MGDVIVVADDEPFVLNVVTSILRRAGFEVLPASSGEQALELARGYPNPIRLLLSDVVMPGLGGPSLADEFSEIHPETECLFMAGLPDTPEVCEKIIRRGREFLPKPFAANTLVNRVQELLQRRPNALATA